jgi:hypothetical protein
MRIAIAGLMAASLCITPVLAADAAGPLAAGKPAGVKKAQAMDEGNTILYIVGGGAIIAGIVLLANNGGDHNTGSTGSSSSSSSSP